MLFKDPLTLCHRSTVCITAARNRSLVPILNGSLEAPGHGRLAADQFLGTTLFLVNLEDEKRVTSYMEYNGIH